MNKNKKQTETYTIGCDANHTFRKTQPARIAFPTYAGAAAWLRAMQDIYYCDKCEVCRRVA